MKYFAKYLPVEEQLQIGDKYMLAFSPGKIETYKDVDYGVFDPVDMSAKKCLLFLCTNDIKKGDEYYTPNDYMFKNICEDDTVSFEECVKIIGKISDEAIWVSEWDEFEKDELLQQGTGVNIIPNKNSIIKIKCKCCNTFK